MAGLWGTDLQGLTGSHQLIEDDDFAATVTTLRESGQAKHMNGDYRGAYMDFRRAARMNPSDQMVWEEYAKAFADYQQQLVEDKDKDKDSVRTQASSRSNINSAWGDPSSITYGTYDSAILQSVNTQSTSPVSASSRARPQEEAPPILPDYAASLADDLREKRKAWQSSKSHRIAYIMWILVLTTVAYHYVTGYVDWEDKHSGNYGTFEPLIPTVTIWVSLFTLLLLWRGGRHFASPLTTTTKALSAFALTVITLTHWVAYWTPNQLTTAAPSS